MKDTKIISGFPGVGKSWLFENQKRLNRVVLDSDSSGFSWVSKGVRNPGFPQNYIEHIKDNIGKVDIIMISSHDVVRNALKENNVPYIIVYPDASQKEIYINRYRQRGNDDKFIEFISSNWSKFISDIGQDNYPSHYRLPKGDTYLSYLFIDDMADEQFQKVRAWTQEPRSLCIFRDSTVILEADLVALELRDDEFIVRKQRRLFLDIANFKDRVIDRDTFLQLLHSNWVNRPIVFTEDAVERCARILRIKQ